MINKNHQGEKMFLDNLYYEDILKEYASDDIIKTNDDEEYYISIKGIWKKLHPFDVVIDKTNVRNIIEKLSFKYENNEFDDRNLSWKPIQFRI